MGPDHVKVERAVVALQAVALVCLVTAAVLHVIDHARSGIGLAIAVAWFVLTPAIGVLWVLRPRAVRAGHGVVLTIVSILLVTPVAVFGTLGFTIPILLLAVAFAVVDVSVRAGLLATVWISSVGFVLLVSGGLGSWGSFLSAALQGLVNVVPVAVLLWFGVVLGVVSRGFEQRRNADQEVIERLRHTSEIKKELLLADERARSARELHDGLGHRLTLVSMSLELAERMRDRDVDQAWQEIHTARDTSNEALAEMRTWVRALSPVRDAEARGLAALEMIAESFRGTGLTVDVTGDDSADRELVRDDAIALVMYRAVQEGLTNALRHSKARTVSIDLHADGQSMGLVIVNDVGRAAELDPDRNEPVLGFGLRGLSDRASEHGGSVRARRLGDQFRLEVSVPLSAVGAESRVAVP